MSTSAYHRHLSAGAKACMQKSLCRAPTTICGALVEPDAHFQDSVFAWSVSEAPLGLCLCHMYPSEICMSVAGGRAGSLKV